MAIFKKMIVCSMLLSVSLAYGFDASPFPTQKWETFHESVPFIIKIDHPVIPYQFKLSIQITTSEFNNAHAIYQDDFAGITRDIAPGQTIQYVTSNECLNKNGCVDDLFFATKSCEVGCYAAGTLTYNFVPN